MTSIIRKGKIEHLNDTEQQLSKTKTSSRTNNVTFTTTIEIGGYCQNNEPTWPLNIWTELTNMTNKNTCQIQELIFENLQWHFRKTTRKIKRIFIVVPTKTDPTEVQKVGVGLPIEVQAEKAHL